MSRFTTEKEANGMYYCENCHLLCEWPVCGYCGTRPLREPRADDYCFLSSRNEPWAQMLA